MEERLGIAGAGRIACGLAATAAPQGEVVLWARSEASAGRARASLDALGERLDRSGDVASVTVTTDLSALAGTTFAVEAIAEDLEAKSKLLADLGAALDGTAVLATTTSSLSVGDLAQASGVPDRFLGLHVFNPVERMELVELAYPDGVADGVRDRARALCAALGKTPVEVPDRPGFVVNRLLFPYLFDAVRLLDEAGLEPEAVDECMRLGAGQPMGPLALLDFVGLDVAVAIGRELGLEAPPRLAAHVERGELGRKSGAGFYRY
jgi:3-hydroxybutyryl-CoA dehydrogenase